MDRLALLGALFFTLVIATNGSMTSASVMAHKGYNPRLGALIGFAVGAAGGMIPALLLLTLVDGRAALAVVASILGSLLALIALWTRTPDIAQQAAALPRGKDLQRNNTSRHIRGTIMTVLSITPGIGTALVWIPAAIILAANGAAYKALGLAAFCAVVVGSLDNILRPALVGKDTQMHELMIFFGTMGGIFMFGVPGIIIGPIVAALFITIWDIYGLAFADVLPEVRSLRLKAQAENENGNASTEGDEK